MTKNKNIFKKVLTTGKNRTIISSYSNVQNLREEENMMRQYQKPTFEDIKYDMEEVLTISGGLNVEDRPPDDDEDWGDLWG